MHPVQKWVIPAVFIICVVSVLSAIQALNPLYFLAGLRPRKQQQISRFRGGGQFLMFFPQNPPDWGQSRKIWFSKFPGSGLKKIEWTLCFAVFPGKKLTKCSQNPGLVDQFSATPRGQLKLDRPYCKHFWFPCFGRRFNRSLVHTWVHQNRTILCGCGGDFYRSPAESRDF